jgi:Asp-tRNA(Asn)/Glu-tRNA(Gln) amidotransferase A subunit family amidase
MTNALLAFAGSVDAFVTLSATGPAPVGLQSSGDPVFAVPFTVMRGPVISLPLLKVEGLPVGIQVAGFPNRDRALSGASEYLMRL